METIPVKKFMLGNIPCFRFPYRKARVPGHRDYAFLLPATDGELFDSNHQAVLMFAKDHGLSALYVSDDWVFAGKTITLDPLGNYKLNQTFTAADVWNALERNGEFTLGDYTYKVV